MAKTPGMIMAEYVPKLPDRRAARLLRLVLFAASIGNKVRFTYGFDRRELKGRQIMILADHAATNSYLYVLRGLNFVQPNVVMGYHNIFQRGLFRLLLACGVIPKRLYTPDVSAVRSMLRLKKEGASFLLFPEGIQSMAGSTMPTDPAAIQLVKKLGLTTVLCRGYGAYLNRPRFDSGTRRGPMEFTYEILFTEDELSRKSEEELYQKYLSRFRYNDFEWNRERLNSYRGRRPNAFGLQKILFICPRCGREFTLSSQGSDIVCSCGLRVRVDEKYLLSAADGVKLPFEGIDGWFLWQRAVMRGEIRREDFLISYDADYLTLDEDRLGSDCTVKLGEGRVTLNREFLRYEGTKNGESVSFEFPIASIPSAPFVSGKGNEFFIGRDYFRFVPKTEKGLPVKVLLAAEELHNLSDPARRRVSEDVYGAEIIYLEKKR